MSLKDSAMELAEVDRKIVLAEEFLKTLTDRKNELETSILPDLMAEAGVKSIKLESGATLTLGTVATGSLPKDPAKRIVALKWLTDNGYGDFIECVVSASFVKGHKAEAESLYEYVKENDQAKVSLDEGIHWKTLTSQMKQRVVEGKETPLDLLGVSVMPRARFTTKGNNGE